MLQMLSPAITTTVAGPAIALHASPAATIAATMASRNLARLSRLVQQQQRRGILALQFPSVPAAAVTVHMARRTAATALAFKARPPSIALFKTPVAATTMMSPRFLTTTPPLAEMDPAKAVPIEISETQYHELADEYLETILSKFEELQDEGEDLDVEFSAGVMTLAFPFGSYVINKQPPNKQIWLSSPKSGPKRYDWVMVGEGQDEKEGTGHGEWVYTRDGTTINDLFMDETGIDLSMPIPHYGE